MTSRWLFNRYATELARYGSRFIERLVLSGMAGLPITLLTVGSLSHTAPEEIGEMGAIAGFDDGPAFEDRFACG
jgi:hypothetical protein